MVLKIINFKTYEKPRVVRKRRKLNYIRKEKNKKRTVTIFILIKRSQTFSKNIIDILSSGNNSLMNLLGIAKDSK